MRSHAWQVATLVLALATLVMWSEPHVNVTFGAFQKSALPSHQDLVNAVSEIQSRVAAANTATASSVPSGVDPASDAKRIDYKPVQNIFPTADKSKGPATDLTKILDSADALAMQSALIPKEGTKSPYGLEFSLDTFNQMKTWSKEIAVDPAWKATYEAITTNSYHPCCGVTISTNDCGHAVAATGLVKKMLQDGKGESTIRTELLLWQKYFFPRHYVIMGLALKKMGSDLSKIDLSRELSTVQSERYASDFLIYQ